jgi:colanic acid/amylovoran biosynthesis glycosyltransferase
MRIAYLVSRFPKITETFVLYEMLALEELGAEIELYPLVRQREVVIHPEATRITERANYARIFSLAVIANQAYWLIRFPQKYLSLWQEVLWENRKSPEYLLRSAAAVILGAHFARRMPADRIEHIHAHFASHAALAALTIHRLTGIPFSFTAHAHDIYVKRTLLKNKIQEAAFIVTISEHNRNFLRNLYGEAAMRKVEIVRCGADQSLFQAPVSRSGNETITMVCVAGLEEKKGHRYLLEACHLLADRGIALRCFLIGDGPLRAEIEAQIKGLNLQRQVIVLGQQTRQQVQQHLLQADLMVLPSVRLSSGKQEGIPVALMEAMAMSLPVIATRLSGIPELVEDGKSGILVSERDPEAIASAVMRLAGSQSLREELGAAGREKVLKEYDLKKNAAQLYGLMKRSSQSMLATQEQQLNTKDVAEGIR